MNHACDHYIQIMKRQCARIKFSNEFNIIQLLCLRSMNLVQIWCWYVHHHVVRELPNQYQQIDWLFELDEKYKYFPHINEAQPIYGENCIQFIWCAINKWEMPLFISRWKDQGFYLMWLFTCDVISSHLWSIYQQRVKLIKSINRVFYSN